MTESFKQLFWANFKIQMRSWRALFWNIFLPMAIYIAASMLIQSTHIITLGGLQIDYSRYLLPGIMAMTIMQTGIFSLAYWLVDIRERGVLKRFKVTPLSNSELIGSLVLNRLILIIFQMVLLILCGIYIFHVHVHGNLLFGLLFILLGGGVFLSMGFLISMFAHSYEEATPFTTVTNLIFTFLGNVFFPTQILPNALRIFGSKLPISYLADGLRQNFVEKTDFFKTFGDLFALTIWLIIVFSLTVYIFKKQNQI